jgi:hypothetical protein
MEIGLVFGLALLVEALCYKPEGVEFGSWISQLNQYFQQRRNPLESTRPVIQMSTRNLPGPARKADNLTAICEPSVLSNVGSSTSHSPIVLR